MPDINDTTSLAHLAAILAPNARLVVVGVRGLSTWMRVTRRLKDSAGFPDAFKPLAKGNG